MTRSQIIKKIHDAAVQYKQHFIGKTYMFVFKSENDKDSKDTVNTGTDEENVSIDNCIEVMFNNNQGENSPTSIGGEMNPLFIFPLKK